MRASDRQHTSTHTINIRGRERARRQVGGAWAYRTAIFSSQEDLLSETV